MPSGIEAGAGAASPALKELVEGMSLREKVGQLTLVHAPGGHVPDWLRDMIREGRVGAVLNEIHVETVNELQRIAVEESAHGVPLLVGRDVIHGFKTVFPIPLGQAASWNPDLVREGARVAAAEAAATGVNWTFAPMVDICRDPRWGRVAETLGEDPYLSGVLAAAMVEGFQGDDLADPARLAACAKHFAGYGASESGRDYNTTNVPENELRNVHLPPFRRAVEAGVATLMTSFSDIDGVPASGNAFLLEQVLRREWGFQGFVVSDWDSIRQLAVHGLTEGDRDSALEAARAGLDMEMASDTYAWHLPALVEEGLIPEAHLDRMVLNVLRVKAALGLFARPYTDPSELPRPGAQPHLDLAYRAAVESAVLLENRKRTLPLDAHRLNRVAVIGPLANDAREQLGTWVFDGEPSLSVTPLQALREALGDRVEVNHVRALRNTWDRSREGFAEAREAAAGADVAILFLGEEAILSGEAHCRSDIRLPGVQEELIREVSGTGTPVVLVVLAGRPLALQGVPEMVDALLYAWHPGTMAGPAIADLLLGREIPVGKLPVTFPRVTGQIPIYYAQKNTGKPVTPESWFHVEDVDPKTPQHSIGNTSFHLDVHYTPLYPFGFGRSYTEFRYEQPTCDTHVLRPGGRISIRTQVSNVGDRAAVEVAQLYIRDLVGSVTRPVKELKGFRRIRLEPGESREVEFEIGEEDLAFHGRDMKYRAEPGRFHAWIGGSSNTHHPIEFELLDHE